ncbi:MAG: hypothetical protein B1H09_03545 [Gemmatimonadaceae bacterium 4484_173]|nr:MAG: hypothetical protein B1H09_03545 [Gemmatimonadaceae bacterium 4484_173]RKZ04070.1 MAG: DUF1456 domain-containing protein [Candidatus Fermentibacteria bacterium]
MLSNDILRRVRYALDLSDIKMVEVFGISGESVTTSQISSWIAREEEPGFAVCPDSSFASFLDGLITDRRGEGGNHPPEPIKHLTSNMVFKKLRIALNLKTGDILQMMELAGYTLGKHELSSFFRRPGHKHYRECTDQTLRKFLKGMQIKFRPSMEN